jgi:rubredoxin
MVVLRQAWGIRVDHTTDAPDYGDNDLWSETLVFPHPARLDDAGMEFYFSRYDGRWSYQTRHAMKKLGAQGLELNSNWALEDQFWSCRGCGRHKREIFRMSANGILLAKLELHHDHLWNECLRRADGLLGQDWRDRLPDGSTIVLDQIRSLVVRFDGAVVCSECNAADGKAKKAVNADPNFSFAVPEIASFITATPHRDHEIDRAAVMAAWEAERPNFERRLAIFDMLVGDLAAGHLQRRTEGRLSVDRSMFERIGNREMLADAFGRSANGTANAELLDGMRSDFLARSVQKDVARKDRPKTAARRPSDEEYHNYVPEKVAAKWSETSDDWACPCCGRGKRALMRMSSKKKWTGNIRSVAQHDILLDKDEIMLRERLFPRFPNDLHLQEMRWVDVCSDCADITTRLGHARRDLTDIYLTLDQMRPCLNEIADNVAHDIDFDLAGEMAASNWRYRHARDAASAFVGLRNSFRTQMEHANDPAHLRWNPHLRQDTFARLDSILEIDHRMEDPQGRKDVMSMFKDGDYGPVATWVGHEEGPH